MLKKAVILVLCVATLAGAGWAQEGDVPKGVGHLDHVFLIMMENHGYGQVLGNPDEPYLNGLIANHKVNLANNYFAVGHPSSTNYLEIVGGSNFGVRSDNAPDWGNAACTPNLLSGLANVDNNLGNTFKPPQPPPIPAESTNVCPITAVVGKDAETPAVDSWNEVSAPANFLADLDGIKSVPAASALGKMIADQISDAGKTWKSYQESLPTSSTVEGEPPAYGVNYADGFFTDATNPPPAALPGGLVKLYAAKHNPFVYFASVQNNKAELANVVPFSGSHGLFEDLATGHHVPNFSFIVPNQCNDQHGRGNAGAGCDFDLSDDGGTAGLNPALISIGDQILNTIVNAIHNSPTWQEGRNAIVIVWDENDYSGVPNQPAPNTLFPPQNQNKVVLTVELNCDGHHGVQSNIYYTSFSLLKSLEAGFRLPCLNHACDATTAVMSDLFGKDDDR